MSENTDAGSVLMVRALASDMVQMQGELNTLADIAEALSRTVDTQNQSIASLAKSVYALATFVQTVVYNQTIYGAKP